MPSTQRDPEPIDLEMIEPILDAAFEIWATAGMDPPEHVDVRIADLAGTQIGAVVGHIIFLDQDAAGWGWFVDPTPCSNEEFGKQETIDSGGGLSDGELIALPNGPATDRMDLLTVVLHELGHVLGMDHADDGDSVMSERLRAGTRRVPTAHHTELSCWTRCFRTSRLSNCSDRRNRASRWHVLRDARLSPEMA